MKLAYTEISAVFDTDIPAVNTLVIENRRFLRKILEDLNNQISGYEGDMVLSVKDRPIPFDKNAELIQDFIAFTLNRKPLLTKMTAIMEKIAVSPEYYTQTQTQLWGIESYILDLSQDFPVEIACTKLTPAALIKSAGIEIVSEKGYPLEQLIDYMELVREIDRDKLFVLVNIRSYFDDHEIEVLFRTILDHEFHVVLIDSFAGAVLKCEKRWTIDEDLCEF